MDFKTWVAFLLLLGFIDAQDNTGNTPIVPVPCLDDDFCRRALPNAKDVKCNKHFCMCLNSDGSLYESCSMKDMVAMPKIIQKIESAVQSLDCKNHEDCNWIVGAKCLDDEEHKPYRSCKCPEKFTVSLEKLECQPILYKLNETCNESSQCQAGLGQAECILVNKTILGMTTGSRKKCLCKPNSHFSKDFQKCVITRSLGEICSGGSTDECYETNKNFLCHNNICVNADALKVQLSSGGTSRFTNLTFIVAILGSVFIRVLM